MEKKGSLSTGRRELAEIVKTCKSIEDRRFNPFFLDFKYAIQTLRRYFSLWSSLNDHCLDVEALNRLSRVVRLQESQLKFQSSTLYSDPEYLEKKFRRLSGKGLVELFLKSWHPIVQLEQYTSSAADEAMHYWISLLPIEERWRRFRTEQSNLPSRLQASHLKELGVLTSKGFIGKIEDLWVELKRRYRDYGEVDYWAFIFSDGYSEAVERAYYVSFLLTYGYAIVTSRKGRMCIAPRNAPLLRKESDVVSLPISISVARWSEWKQRQRANASTETN